MPELPEVEGVVRQLATQVEGKTITKVEVSSVIRQSKLNGKNALIKNKSVDDFIHDMEFQQIESVERRSKYIVFHLSKGNEKQILLNHLGMTGVWFYVKSKEEIEEQKYQSHIHVAFYLNDEHILYFSDMRRFGEFRLLHSFEEFPPFLNIAPEPFQEKALDHYLRMVEKEKYKKKSIKETIMDGAVIAGCGNIYATESLFRLRIHPARKTERISKKRKVELFHTIVDVLNEAIESGGSSISDYRNINGEAGGMQDRLQIYGKQICPTCQRETKQQVLGGRNSWYCPSCQR